MKQRDLRLLCVVLPALVAGACEGVTSGGSTGGGAGGAMQSGSGGAPPTGAGGAPTTTGTGGAPATTGTGGAPATTGTGGAPATTGTGGAPGGSGCNAASWPAGDQMYTIDVAGIARQYIVGLPTGYDGRKPERLVFAFHGRTGTAMQIAGTGTRGYYGLRTRMTDTIFVAPQGLGTDADAADTGWPNTSGRDIAFVRAMIASLGASYCIDGTRIFSAGMSYGGIMSHTIGCQMSDVFRAIAPIAGAMFGGRGNSCLARPIAAWMAHGTADDQVAFTDGSAARDRILATNHCAATTQPVTPSPCVAYDGCDGGFPVHWCVHDGGHIVPTFAAEGIANFFLSF